MAKANNMIPGSLEPLNSDATLLRDVLDSLILKQETHNMEPGLKNDVSLVQLLKSGFIAVFAWPVHGATLETSANGGLRSNKK
jgi:hypothetical protein